jgi:hypothetical protein
MQDHTVAVNRRTILKLSAGAAAIGAGLPILCKPAVAQSVPLKVGLMLPLTKQPRWPSDRIFRD